MIFCLLPLKWEILEGWEPTLFIFVPPAYSTLPSNKFHSAMKVFLTMWPKPGMTRRSLHRDDKASQLSDHLVSLWTWEGQFLDSMIIFHPRLWPSSSISSFPWTDNTWVLSLAGPSGNLFTSWGNKSFPHPSWAEGPEHGVQLHWSPKGSGRRWCLEANESSENWQGTCEQHVPRAGEPGRAGLLVLSGAERLERPREKPGAVFYFKALVSRKTQMGLAERQKDRCGNKKQTKQTQSKRLRKSSYDEKENMM